MRFRFIPAKQLNYRSPVRTLDSSVIEAKNSVASTARWTWLLELYPNATQTAYMTCNNSNILFGGIIYQAVPFDVGEQTEDGSGNPSSLTINVSNVTCEMSGMLERNRGFQNRKVTLRLICIPESGIPVEALSQTFRVQRTVVTDTVCTFTLGNDDLFKASYPQQKFFRERCRWQYGGAMCGYTGSLPKCDKTLRGADGCEAHANARRFGGFPGIPKT